MRATLRLSSPAWLAQPRNTSSTCSRIDGLRSMSARIGTAAKIVSAHARQRTAITSDGRANRIADKDFAHRLMP